MYFFNFLHQNKMGENAVVCLIVGILQGFMLFSKLHFLSNMFKEFHKQDNERADNLGYLGFTTSVFRDSTCRSETGSTASASPRQASPWSSCKDQTYCAENREGDRRSTSGSWFTWSDDRKSDGALHEGQDWLELLDPGQHLLVFVVAQMCVVSVGMPGVEGMVANHVQALRNTRERERWGCNRCLASSASSAPSCFSFTSSGMEQLLNLSTL